MLKPTSSLRWLAAAFLALAGTAAAALPTVNVGTLPPGAPPSTELSIVISGDWPDGCTPEKFATITTKRTDREFVVTFTYTPFGGGACATVVTPYKVTIPVGTLDYGVYTVVVQQERPLLPPALLGSGSFEVKDPLVTVYVPGVGTSNHLRLASSVAAFNNGAREAVARYVASYDGEGMRDLSGSAPIVLAPGDGAVLDTRPQGSGQAVQFLAVAVSPGVSLHPALERFTPAQSLGRLALPSFTAPFAAGTTTVAGNVILSSGECNVPEIARRLNLTLFNAGTASATFRVDVVTRGGSPGPGGERASDVEVVVPAKSVRQLNNIALDAASLCAGASAWLQITADQPYLAYASTVRPDDDGILPYEVFPAKVDR